MFTCLLHPGARAPASPGGRRDRSPRPPALPGRARSRREGVSVPWALFLGSPEKEFAPADLWPWSGHDGPRALRAHPGRENVGLPFPIEFPGSHEEEPGTEWVPTGRLERCLPFPAESPGSRRERLGFLRRIWDRPRNGLGTQGKVSGGLARVLGFRGRFSWGRQPDPITVVAFLGSPERRPATGNPFIYNDFWIEHGRTRFRSSPTKTVRQPIILHHG